MRNLYRLRRACAFTLSLLLATSLLKADNTGIFNVLDFGAKGDGASRDTAAIQKAVDAAAAQGGGQVLLPAGKVFLSGSITLRSHVDFHLAGGTLLKGSANWRDYGRAGSLLFAENAQGIVVSGDGTIDGNDLAVWQKLADEEAGGDLNKPGWWPQTFTGDYWPFGKKTGAPQTGGGRPLMIIFVGCDQVRLRDLTLQKAPSWTIHLVGCHDVILQSLSIQNNWDIPNNDGIDLDHCRDVRIANCLLRCADDGIVIKNTPNFAQYGPTEKVTVTGCEIESRSAALKIDEIYTDAARDLVFANCVIRHSNRGLCIQSRDIGDIENVLFDNLTIETRYWTGKWWGAGEPIHISQLPRNPDTKLGHVQHIRFSNILCRSENGAFFQGTPGNPIDDVVLDNVRLEITKTGDEKGGYYDLRPQNGPTNGVFYTRLAGVYARNLRGFSLVNSAVAWNKLSANDYGLALDYLNVERLELNHFNGPPSPAHQLPPP
jgi:polygalacturonase